MKASLPVAMSNGGGEILGMWSLRCGCRGQNDREGRCCPSGCDTNTSEGVTAGSGTNGLPLEPSEFRNRRQGLISASRDEYRTWWTYNNAGQRAERCRRRRRDSGEDLYIPLGEAYTRVEQVGGVRVHGPAESPDARARSACTGCKRRARTTNVVRTSSLWLRASTLTPL